MSHSTRSLVLRFAAILLVSLLLTACRSDEEKLTQFYDQGMAYVEEEKFNEAVIEFKNVLKIDPNNAGAHYELAKAYMKLKKGRDAYWELSETVRLDPSNIEARLSLGAIAMLARDHEQGLAQGEAVLELEPDNAQALLLTGRALQVLARPDEAEKMYLRAVEIDSESRSTLLILASFYERQSRREEAEPWFWKAAEQGQDFKGYTALGKFLVRDPNRYAEAEEAFQNASRVVEEDERMDAYQNLAAFYIATDRGELGAQALQEGIDAIDEDTQLVYMLARYYRSEGDEEKAEELVRGAAAQNPDDPEPALVLSAYLGKKGDLSGALEAVDAALAADPTHVNARLRKAELLIDLGFREVIEERDAGDADVDAASNASILEGLELVDAVLVEVPSLAEGRFVRGKALLAMGRPEEGIDALRAAADGKPDWAEAHFVLGSALATVNDQSGARRELARAVELDPTLLEARRMLATIHQVLGEHEYAIEQGQRYLRARPDHNATRVLVAQSLLRIGKSDQALAELEKISAEDRDAAVYFALGRMRLSEGNVEEARVFLLEANALAPNNPKVLRALFQVDRMNPEHLAETEATIAKAVEENPEDGSLQQLAGMVAFNKGDLQGAEDAFKRASEADPGNMETHQQLARFYQLTGRTDETIETYKTALEVQPDNAKLHHFLAMLYESQGETELAIASYEAAIAADSQHGQAKNNLAYLLADQDRDLDRALDLAQDSKALLPNSSNSADTLGWVLYKRGVPSAAIGYLKEAVDGTEPGDPTLGIIRQHLALAYEADGQKAKALELVELNLNDLDRRNREAQAAGQRVGSPSWEPEAREMFIRLSAG